MATCRVSLTLQKKLSTGISGTGNLGTNHDIVQEGRYIVVESFAKSRLNEPGMVRWGGERLLIKEAF